jgi:hypothetical protein
MAQAELCVAVLPVLTHNGAAKQSREDLKKDCACSTNMFHANSIAGLAEPDSSFLLLQLLLLPIREESPCLFPLL